MKWYKLSLLAVVTIVTDV